MQRMVGDELGVDRCGDASKDAKRIYIEAHIYTASPAAICAGNNRTAYNDRENGCLSHQFPCRSRLLARR